MLSWKKKLLLLLSLSLLYYNKLSFNSLCPSRSNDMNSEFSCDWWWSLKKLCKKLELVVSPSCVEFSSVIIAFCCCCCCPPSRLFGQNKFGCSSWCKLKKKKNRLFFKNYIIIVLDNLIHFKTFTDLSSSLLKLEKAPFSGGFGVFFSQICNKNKKNPPSTKLNLKQKKIFFFFSFPSVLSILHFPTV